MSLLFVSFKGETRNALRACFQTEQNQQLLISKDHPLRLEMYTWRSDLIKCNCYVWPLENLIDNLYPSMTVLRSNARCDLSAPVTSCYAVNYTVCSPSENCSSVYKGNYQREHESGSFDDPHITTPNVWYHRILLLYEALNRPYAYIEILRKYMTEFC